VLYEIHMSRNRSGRAIAVPSVARMVDDDSTLGAREGPKDELCEVESARTGVFTL